MDGAVKQWQDGLLAVLNSPLSSTNNSSFSFNQTSTSHTSSSKYFTDVKISPQKSLCRDVFTPTKCGAQEALSPQASLSFSTTRIEEPSSPQCSHKGPESIDEQGPMCSPLKGLVIEMEKVTSEVLSPIQIPEEEEMAVIRPFTRRPSRIPLPLRIFQTKSPSSRLQSLITSATKAPFSFDAESTPEKCRVQPVKSYFSPISYPPPTAGLEQSVQVVNTVASSVLNDTTAQEAFQKLHVFYSGITLTLIYVKILFMYLDEILESEYGTCWEGG